MNEPLIQNIVQPGQIGQPLVILKTSNIYDKAQKHFTETQKFLCVYAFFKFAFGLIIVSNIAKYLQIILNYTLEFCKQGSTYTKDDKVETAWGQDYFFYWMIAIIVHSFFATIYYLALSRYVGNENQNLQVANQLENCFFIEIPNNLATDSEIQQFVEQEASDQNNQLLARLEQEGQQEESRRIQMLAIEIKKVVQSKSYAGKYIGKPCFFIFQFLEVWGLIFYFKNYPLLINGCESFYLKYLLVVLFLGLYQYMDIYVLCCLVIIFFPILLCYGFYDWIRDQIKKRKVRRRINIALDELVYQEDKLQETEAECSICMSNYQKGEKIVVLQCSEKHHFHYDCLQAWLSVNQICPLCRNNALSKPDIAQQNNI